MGKESAAAAVSVGEDMLAELPQPWAVSSRPRLLTHVAIVGSNAELDFKADVVVGEKIVATLYNSSEGAVSPKRDVDMFPIGAYVGPSAPVQLIVRDASNTNPVVFAFAFRRWNRRRRRRRRFFRRRRWY